MSTGSGLAGAFFLPPPVAATTGAGSALPPAADEATPREAPAALRIYPALPDRYPDALRPENWQAERGLRYRTVAPKTGLSERLREVEQYFQRAATDQHLLPDNGFSGVPMDPLQIDTYMQQEFDDPALPALQALLNAINDAYQHALDTQRAIKDSLLIPKKERGNVGEVIVALNALRRSTDDRFNYLQGPGLRATVDAACRDKLRNNGRLAAMYEYIRTMPLKLKKLQSSINETTTLNELRHEFTNNDGLRSCSLIRQLWNDKLSTEFPALISEIGTDALDNAVTELVRRGGGNGFVNDLTRRIEADQVKNAELVAMNAQANAARERRNQAPAMTAEEVRDLQKNQEELDIRQALTELERDLQAVPAGIEAFRTLARRLQELVGYTPTAG